MAVYPEPGGILSWGGDGGGAVCHWDTASWDVVVTGRPVYEPERYALNLTAYAGALRNGTIEAAGLGNWPSRDATFRRRTEN